jgi:hypothetical protein
MDDVRWLTYAELADALGIGSDSARNLVRRKRWQRQTGNDGLTRVAVPLEHLDKNPKSDGDTDPPADPPINPPADGGTSGPIIDILNRHIERLEREVETLKTERDFERARAAQVDVLTAVLDVEKRRAEELRQDRDRLVDRLTVPEPRDNFISRLRRAFK